MRLDELITALADSKAYPRPGPVEVRQTHLSVAFLVGDDVYKIRKPVNLGFVDFRTLDSRKRDCEEEVRLNRRLAAKVYRGVVAIVMDGEHVRVDRPGEAIEWAVEMVRLPEDATLRERLRHDQVTSSAVEAVAFRIAEFHRNAERGDHISRYGQFDVVAGNARENFEQTANHVGNVVRKTVYDRCRNLTERAVVDLRALIESRASRGVPCDTHGDLHLSHIYCFPDRAPPDDLVIIDCIEFTERFRFADPIADMAFLTMDLGFYGRRDLARAFADAYFRSTGDDEGRRLLSYYIAYRAIVRAKVEGMQLSEKEIPEEQRERMCRRAEAHWLLALGALEPPSRRPCLVLIGGLPGTGKSTLARGLAAGGCFNVVRSDVIRKELAGVPIDQKAEGRYTADWTARTYSECLRRAIDDLRNGGRVIVDASFSEEGHREAFIEAAEQLGVPVLLLICRVDPEVARERLHNRRGDASDADWSVYEELAERWDRMSESTDRCALEINTTDSNAAIAIALARLNQI